MLGGDSAAGERKQKARLGMPRFAGADCELRVIDQGPGIGVVAAPAALVW